MAFSTKQIRVTFTKALNPVSGARATFSSTGSDTLTVSGLRVSTVISKFGGQSMGAMEMQIFGLPQSLMNELSTLGMKISLVPKNLVTVEAGDDDSGLAVVFQGTVLNCFSDYDSAPDVSMHVEAYSALGVAVAPCPPTNIKGAVDIGTIMQSLATRAGLRFENNCPPIILSNRYYYGSAYRQAGEAARDANVNVAVDLNTLIIWPRYGSRNGAPTVISPQTGMISYPGFVAQGVVVRTLFNPALGLGGKIQVKNSSVTPANGIWAVGSLTYNLDAMMPNGKWEAAIQAYNPAFAPEILK